LPVFGGNPDSAMRGGLDMNLDSALQSVVPAEGPAVCNEKPWATNNGGAWSDERSALDCASGAGRLAFVYRKHKALRL
jgi:hypothetical protein